MFYLIQSRIALAFILMIVYTFSKVRFSKKIMTGLTVIIFAVTFLMDYFVYTLDNKLLLGMAILKNLIILLFCFIVSKYHDIRGILMGLFAMGTALGGSSIAVLWYASAATLYGSIGILIVVYAVVYGVIILTTRKYVLRELERNNQNWLFLCLLPVLYMASVLLLVSQCQNDLLNHYFYIGILLLNLFALFVFEIIVRTCVAVEKNKAESDEKKKFGTVLKRNTPKSDELLSEKKSLGVYGVSLVVAGCVIFGTFLGLFIHNYRLNSKGMSFPLSEVMAEDSGNEVFMVKMEKRDGSADTWTKGINLGKPGYYELQAYTYDMVVTNKSENQIEEWWFEFNAPQNMYINKAWCGTVEIHQSSEFETIVDEVDLRHPKKDEIKLDLIDDETDIIIPIKKGNKVIYRPNPRVYEYPIAASNPATDKYNRAKVGFIFYYNEGDEPLQINDGTFFYKINYVFLEQKATKITLFIGLIWLIALMFYLGFIVRRKSFEKKLLKDREMIHEVMDVFTGFVDAKDTYTAGHSDRVAIYSRLIAEKMGYSEEEAWQVYYAGQLHDCGKVGIPESILNKAAKLTPEEFGVIKSHTTSGYEMLKNLDTIPTAAVVAKYHHERYDGTGYPEGLKGEEIPEIARIACVADSFDAMNSSRVYRPRLERSYIVSQLEQGRGTQFDPKIVDLFLGLLADGSVDNAYGDEYFKNVCAEILE